jgi:hypothetical protein
MLDRLLAWLRRNRPITPVGFKPTADDPSDINWRRLPMATRRAMLRDLRAWIGEPFLEMWRREGLPPFFHFDQGMAIRNRLRDRMPDWLLPAVHYEDGFEARNWDDYYMGAVNELLRTKEDT